MPFKAEAHQGIIINGTSYEIAEHPAAPGMPYGQEGRQAIVYKILLKSAIGGKPGEGHSFALKVFKAHFRFPSLVSLTERLGRYATIPGLGVCKRTVLTPRNNPEILAAHPDLIYSIVMPWLDGPTWMEVLLDAVELTRVMSLTIARSFADQLSFMEEFGTAHCDISGPNLILTALAEPPVKTGPAVALVDVEQMYGPNLDRPEMLPGGSPGYAHKTAPEGLWGPSADRFAGAIIISEMLGWCDRRVREAAWGENFFDPGEMQKPGSARYDILLKVIREHWGNNAGNLLKRAWCSESLTECPTMGEWLLALPKRDDGRTEEPPTAPEKRELSATQTQGRPEPSDVSLYATPPPKMQISREVICSCNRKLEVPAGENRLICSTCETEWTATPQGNFVGRAPFRENLQLEGKEKRQKTFLIAGIAAAVLIVLLGLAAIVFTRRTAPGATSANASPSASASFSVVPPPTPSPEIKVGFLEFRVDLRGAKVKIYKTNGALYTTFNGNELIVRQKTILSAPSPSKDSGSQPPLPGSLSQPPLSASLSQPPPSGSVSQLSPLSSVSQPPPSSSAQSPGSAESSPPPASTAAPDDVVDAEGAIKVELNPGEYIIKVCKADFYDIVKGDKSKGILLEMGKTINIDDRWIRRPSFLVKTNVEANIFVNGEKKGKTRNLSLEIKGLDTDRAYKVTARREGYRDRSESITFKARGEMKKFTLALSEIPPAPAYTPPPTYNPPVYHQPARPYYPPPVKRGPRPDEW